VLATCLCAEAQTTLSVEQLVSFVNSSIRLKHPDRQVATYIARLKLKEKLDDATIEDMQGMGAGPKTIEALKTLRDATRNLEAPKPPTPKPVPAAIPPPSAAEQARVLKEIREYALNYSKSLPNFICVQVTRRYADRTGMQFWAPQDTITARLSYFEQKEDYKVMLVNDRPSEASFDALGGATSTGEFGSMLREIFEPDSHTRFAWERWATLRGKRTHVYKFYVSQLNSKYRIDWQRKQQIVVAYMGLIYVDRDTDTILRITLNCDIPPSFPVQEAATVLDYDMVKIGDREFMLPLKAVVNMREAKYLTKNDVEFRMYRKFETDAVIKFETPDALPEDQTKEQAPK
jgi:hypothetical protein